MRRQPPTGTLAKGKTGPERGRVWGRGWAANSLQVFLLFLPLFILCVSKVCAETLRGTCLVGVPWISIDFNQIKIRQLTIIVICHSSSVKSIPGARKCRLTRHILALIVIQSLLHLLIPVIAPLPRMAKGSRWQLVARKLVRIQDILHREGQSLCGSIAITGRARRGGVGINRRTTIHRSRQINRADLENMSVNNWRRQNRTNYHLPKRNIFL